MHTHAAHLLCSKRWSPIKLNEAYTEMEAYLQGEGMSILLHGLLQHETSPTRLSFCFAQASGAQRLCRSQLLGTLLQRGWPEILTPASVMLQLLLCCSTLHYLAYYALRGLD